MTAKNLVFVKIETELTMNCLLFKYVSKMYFLLIRQIKGYFLSFLDFLPYFCLSLPSFSLSFLDSVYHSLFLSVRLSIVPFFNSCYFFSFFLLSPSWRLSTLPFSVSPYFLVSVCLPLYLSDFPSFLLSRMSSFHIFILVCLLCFIYLPIDLSFLL